MRLGITGTRYGTTRRQGEELAELLTDLEYDEFHHGDCIGVDGFSHDAVRLYKPECQIHVHPPIDPSRRANKHGDVEYRAQPFLDRNKAIVAMCDTLIAVPHEDEERLRSGTWTTVRFARHWQRTHDLTIMLIQTTGRVITITPDWQPTGKGKHQWD